MFQRLLAAATPSSASVVVVGRQQPTKSTAIVRIRRRPSSIAFSYPFPYKKNIQHTSQFASYSSSSSSSSSINENNQQQLKNQKKRLDVAIVGAPNAGKSQLLNVLTQSSVSAVSRKRHTTRTDVLGARTIGETQIVFKDTPGFLRIENAKAERLDRDLIATAAAELQTVDYSLIVVDSARKLSPTYLQALEQLMKGALNSSGRIDDDYDAYDEKSNIDTVDDNEDEALVLRPKFAIVLNKIDLIKDKSNLIEMAMEIGEIADQCISEKFIATTNDNDVQENLDDIMMNIAPIVFYVSALKDEENKNGCQDIVDHLLALATPCHNWIVDADETTTLTEIEQIEEIIREKLYRCLHREVPHSIKQINRVFHKVPQGVIVHQDLIVTTKSHRKLVLGTGGRTLQRIEETSMKDLTKLFDCEVSLRLHVKHSKSNIYD